MNSSRRTWLPAVLGCLCLVLAIAARSHFQHPYETLAIHAGSNQNSTHPAPWLMLWHRVSEELGRFCRAFLVPEILLALAVFGFWRGAGERGPREISPSVRPWLWALATLGLVRLVRWWVLHDTVWGMDEFGYDFQARIFAAGQWVQGAPPMAEFYTCNNLVLFSGRWFGIQPPGWPAVLALPFGVGLQDWVPALMSAFTVVGLWFLTREIYGVGAAVWVGPLVWLNPALLLGGASFFSHSAVLMWSCWTWLLSLRARRSRSPLVAVLAGLSLAMVINTRYADAVLLVAVLLPYHLALERHERGPWWSPHLFLIPLVSALGALFLLSVNAASTGSPWQSGWVVEGLQGGFFTNPWVDRLWYALTMLTRQSLWASPLYLVLLFLTLQRRDVHCGAAWALALLHLVAFSCWSAQVEIGSRYLLQPTGLLIPFLSQALARQRVSLQRVGLGACLAFSLLGAYPGLVAASQRSYLMEAQREKWLQSVTGGKALVFVAITPEYLASGWTRNRPDLSGVVRALMLEPEVCARLRRLYPDRPAYRLEWSFPAGQLVLRPYEETDPGYHLLAAGINCANSLKQPLRAIACWRRVPDASLYAPTARLNELTALVGYGDPQEAVALARRLADADPRSPQVAELETRALHKAGQLEQSRAAALRWSRLLPPGSRWQAEQWLR